jgi:hypothetical protein
MYRVLYGRLCVYIIYSELCSRMVLLCYTVLNVAGVWTDVAVSVAVGQPCGVQSIIAFRRISVIFAPLEILSSAQ